MALKVFELDPYLKTVEKQIVDRVDGYRRIKADLEKNEGGIAKFAEGYRTFGFNRTKDGYVFREWLPNAKKVWMVGEFNDWQENTPLKADDFGRWSLELPDKKTGESMIPHGSQLKLRVETADGKKIDRVPAWIKLAVQDPKSLLFNGVFWEPPEKDCYTFRHPRPARHTTLKIYEAHVGMGTCEPKVASYLDFARIVLPRIKRLGYNAVQLMAVAEHAHYGCFGYHVTSFFAPASRSGKPEEVKEMVDIAHSLGIQVLVDLVHAHCSSNAMDGIAQMDGTDYCYTHGGPKGHHTEWDSKIFDYAKYEVMRFLLSNVRWWLEEYRFDGFRFDGVTSMLYKSHGIGKSFGGGYDDYFGGDAEVDSHVYMMLANELIHDLVPSAVTVGEDVSGMPTLCRPVSEGGFGFDYRLAMAIPDMFIKMLKEGTDDSWNIGHIVHTLTNRRWKEAVIAYAESHDQAIVGDKTIAFWLMDAAMYTDMSLIPNPKPSMAVDRGLALHKMIRLLVLGLGGEGYLNFMGNEFGHPEWIDFPTEQNGWSYQHCRRRWDLADDPNLRYKHFESFDEVMQACENRFKFLQSEHEYVTLKDEEAKVIVFERGDLLFVFNLHPTKSFTDYIVGHQWNEPMRTILDTDEPRFGGHNRLEYGHANSYPPLGGAQGRPHSLKLYLPARTAQVLIPEKFTKLGFSIHLGKPFLQSHGLKDATGVKLTLKDPKDPAAAGQVHVFDRQGCISFCDRVAATVELTGPGGKPLPCKASPDGKFQFYFPGVYTIWGTGYIEAGLPVDQPAPGTEPKALTSRIVEAGCPPSPAKPPPATMSKEGASAAAAAPAAPASPPKSSQGYPSSPAAAAVGAASPASAQAPSSAKPTPSHDRNVPDYLSDAGLEGMARLSSLSAFDHLLEPEDAVKLREEAVESQDRIARYGAKHLSTPVVIVSSEVTPWSKSGGLGMVASSYAYEFAMRGHRTMCISPRYDDFKDTTWVGKTNIWMQGQDHEVNYYQQYIDFGGGKGCDYIFIDNLCYKRPAGLYCDTVTGKEYDDNLFRFALFSLAALEAPLILNLGGTTYGADVMFIANDWQTSLMPVYLLYKYRHKGIYINARSMFVIHNMGFQGKYSKTRYPIDTCLGLPPDAAKDMECPHSGPDCLNLLAAALRTCDRVLTVSPNYCLEIQTPEGSYGMHDLLRAKASHLRLAGILNGISDEWNPMVDPHIPQKYGAADFQVGKAACKKALQKELGLKEDPNVCLLGFCGRLSAQKGVHLIMACLEWLMHDQGNGINGSVQVIMMGKGEAQFAQWLSDAESRHKGRICGYVGFDPKVEHRMMAGCDLILMPSQYEPCGLPQMYAQAYASLPVVHETGGLKDSVKGLWEPKRDRDSATGFLFTPYSENPFKERLYQAMEVFQHDKPLFTQMQTNAISSNYYWPAALDEYERHIDYTLDDPPARS